MRFLSAVLATLFIPVLASAQEVMPAPSGSIPLLAPVTVSGVQPGPGLWKVSRGDHVLWLLGTTSALPANMQWRSDEVERIAQERG